ncbi:helix-turn-helix domain-containing protein [Streptomyces sp. NPDC058084]|uniref:helix-turn-helix domain-containing protein n=1 Tax=Streptomyces sp. NPDC058084 TaxID=3346333 RepID=UPI0036F044E1
MSIEAMAWAFRQNISKPGAKLVLLALCDFADESWSCFPGQETLAVKTSQGERTVRRHLEWLEQEGYIVSRARFSNGRRTSNRYTIHAPRPQAPPRSTTAAPGGGTPAPQGTAKRRGTGGGGKRTKQAAKSADGQSDLRPDQAEEPAKVAGEPSDSHQINNPLPPADGDRRHGAGGCTAHPDSPAANCRSCGTSPRARRAAAAASEKREREQRARDRDRQWFEEQRAQRARAAELEERGAMDGPRSAAREAVRRSGPRKRYK